MWPAVVLLLSAQALMAQTVDLSGTVADETGNSLAGISVQLKGTGSGTATARNGPFLLRAVPAASRITISGVGYESQEIAASPVPVLVILKADNRFMNEVVVTGVGVATSKRKVALDVGSLASKDIAKTATASIEQALQGKIAGASVQFTSGVPGTAAQIVLRGINDLGATPPMILVDGVEVNGGLNGLDLSAVERIEVVKGAAGGTLYGAQGTNGVIQVFTKRGSRGRCTELFYGVQLHGLL